MRALLSVLLSMLVLVGSAAPAQATGQSREEAAPAQGRREAVEALSDADARVRRMAAGRLGEIGTMADVPVLVGALRDVDGDTRDNAEQAMWRIFARSGDAGVDRLYAAGIRQMEAGELGQAIATFSRIIEWKPDFAEAWNKRATLYFIAGELRKSLADCDEVIKRNPYHFGALAGYVQIYMQLEFYDRALEYSRRAIAVNPNMEGVKRNMLLLERLQEERRRQMI